MSFEAIFIASDYVDLSTQNKVISCFESKETFQVIERRVSNEQSTHVYSYAGIQREDRPEDFYVSLEQKEVYLCFYSATTEQQSRITHFLAECLHEAGIQGDFEEL